jgi:hypothetical protein
MHQVFHRFLLTLIVLLILLTQTTWGHARRFAYTQQSMVFPAHATELEIWNTFLYSRKYFYRRLDTRFEFEYGLGGNLMTALYLNHEMKTFDEGQGAPGGSKATEATVSLSNEWKYKLMDPAADPFGFALYGEGTIGLDEAELEGKLIFDKQVGPAILACNLVVEHEWEVEIEDGVTETTKALKPNIDAGIAWFVTSSFSIGAEGRWLNVFEEGDLTHSALFVGPSLAYSSDKIWLAFTFLPQVANVADKVSGRIDLTEFERYQARLLFSLEL